MYKGLMAVVCLSLVGCATQHWVPAAGHNKVTLVSAVKPVAIQHHMGVTIFSNDLTSVDLGFDVNNKISQIVRDSLVQSGRYQVMDMPFDAAIITGPPKSGDEQFAGTVMPKPMADALIKAAKGRGLDYIIVITDVRGTKQLVSDWGLYQHWGGCEDAYISFYVFVVDANTGSTLATGARTGFRRIEDLDWDTAWADIPSQKRADIMAALDSIVQEDVPREMMQLGILQDDGKPDYLAPSFFPPTCQPRS
jgi:hypothetical protein